MNLIKQIVFCYVLVMSINGFSQILAPAKWECNVSKQNPKQGEIVELIFKVELDDTWHLYSNKQNYDLGPLPAVFQFEPNKGYILVGDVKAIGVKTKHEEVFEVDVNYFEGTAEFRQKVKILSSNLIIKGTYSYQVCTTVDGKCIMGDDEFEFKINTIN